MHPHLHKLCGQARCRAALLLGLPLLPFALNPIALSAQEITSGVLDAVEVRDSGINTDVYSATESSGSKTALPLRELPQSVQVVTSQTIEDLGAQRVDDLLDYVAGVTRKENHGGMWDGVMMRGFSNGIEALYNGFSVGRGYAAPRDLSGVERVEFLKGTAAALYGSGEPSGTVNIVSKRPLWAPAHSVQLRAGSHDFYRASIDTSAPLSEAVAYRLNVALEDKKSFRDNYHAKRHVINPALTWKINANTALEYVGEILEQKAPTDRGVVALDNKLGVIPTNRFLGQPKDGNMVNKNQVHQFIFSHDINADWRARVGATWRDNSLYGYSTEGDLNVPLSPTGELTSNRRLRDYSSTDKAVQAEVQGRLHTAAIKHDLLVGMEHFRFEEKNQYSGSKNFTINIYNPVYLDVLPDVVAGAPTLGKQRNTALYAQDALSLGEHWRLLLGVRFDKYKQESWNRNTGVSSGSISPSATSPRLGLSYLPNSEWTIFTNIGRAFKPNSGTDFYGGTFAPVKSVAADAGVKWESSDKNLGSTLSAFAIRKKNVKTADPDHVGFSITTGEVRSQGLEWDISGRLSSQWRTTASISYTDAEVYKDNNLVEGAPLQHSAKISSGLYLAYENAFANGQRYGIGSGIVYSSKRLGQSITRGNAAQGRFYTPSYTLARLNAYWHPTPNMRVSLEVDNLFNKTWYSSALGRIAVVPGEERTVMLGMTYKF